jgi:hypothetical protein
MIVGLVQASPALFKPGQTEDSSVTVVFAQEDPANYPGSNPLEGESFDAGENPDHPEVVGTSQYPSENRPSGLDSEVQNRETAVPTSGLTGKIYLWLAFTAALIIFTAVILGAILLYTRQRYKE